MKSIIFLVLLGVVASSSPSDWLEFKRVHNKNYKSTAEEAERKEIFLENANRIQAYQRTHPNATFTIGINHLADRRIEELLSIPKRRVTYRRQKLERSDELMDLPDSLDWREKGVISKIKDQGMTGQVGAIVGVEVVESFHAIQTGSLVDGSVARVLDCCTPQIEPFECIAKLRGICTAADYPTTTGRCSPDACKPFANFAKVMRLKTKSEDTMVEWIQNSTLFVGVDASQTSFEFYTGGIYKDGACSQTMVDHVLQLVGYGKTGEGELYWICKNTWGMGWGEQGYIRILRGQNTCGIATYVMQVA